MATQCVTIKGLSETVKKLRDLGQNVDKIADNSLRKSARDIKREVEDRIEAVGAVDTGRLRNSITIKKLGQCQYAVGTDVEYAPYVEFGTGSMGDPAVAHNVSDMCVRKDKKTGKGKIVHFSPHPPRPYMRPAFNAKRDVVMLNLTNAITKAWSKGVGS